MTRPRSPIRLVLALAVAGLLVAGCGDAGAQPAGTSPPKVAFFEDLSVPDTLDTVLPASLSMQAYLRTETDAGRPASFELVPFDTGGDPSTALEDAKTVANDPTYVAAVAGPFWIEPTQVADALGAAGVPVLNLSAAGMPPSAGQRGWVSLVASLGSQTRALATLASEKAGSRPVCEGGDTTPWSQLVARGVDEAAPAMHPLPLPLDPALAVPTAARRGCGAILWTGFEPGAEALRASVRPSVDVVGADGMKTWSYLSAAPPGTSSFVACSCVDVNTSTTPAVQTFINGDQVATGLTPGVFAAEAWDASAILGTFMTAGVDRASARAGLDRVRSYRGVATTYRFEPAVPLPAREFRGVGSRWIAT